MGEKFFFLSWTTTATKNTKIRSSVKPTAKTTTTRVQKSKWTNSYLVNNLFDLWPICVFLVDLCHYWHNKLLHGLELFIVHFGILLLVSLQPVDLLTHQIINRLDFFLGQIIARMLSQRCSYAEQVAFESVPWAHTPLMLLVLFAKLLSVRDHSIDFALAQATFLVFDLDVFALACALLLGIDVQDPIGVQIECDLNPRDSSRRWNNKWNQLGGKNWEKFMTGKSWKNS